MPYFTGTILTDATRAQNLCSVKLLFMPGKRSFDEQLAALERLRQIPPEETVAPLRKALQHRNNFVVAKAADLVRGLRLPQLIPDLIAAFDRFLVDSVKTDPQCWAKNAISRTLADFEYQEPDVFLRGIRHLQLEPGWGGSSDTAGTLRATCALALVQCRSLPDVELFRHLIDLMQDKEKFVRAEAVHAIELVGSPSSALLLRLKATLGSDEPEVLGACYSGILRLDGVPAIPWVSRFLDQSDDSAAEAALAIAGTHSPQAFEVLRACLAEESDPWFISVLLSAIALTRQDAAVEFLFDQVRSESLQAEAAIEALLRAMPSPEITTRLEELVAGNPRLARAFVTNRPASK